MISPEDYILFSFICSHFILFHSNPGYYSWIPWKLLCSLGTVIISWRMLCYCFSRQSTELCSACNLCFDFCRWWFNTQFNSLSLVLHAGLQVCHARVSSRVRRILVWAIHRIRNPSLTASPHTLLPRDPIPWFLSPGNTGILLKF